MSNLASQRSAAAAARVLSAAIARFAAVALELAGCVLIVERPHRPRSVHVLRAAEVHRGVAR